MGLLTELKIRQDEAPKTPTKGMDRGELAARKEAMAEGMRRKGSTEEGIQKAIESMEW